MNSLLEAVRDKLIKEWQSYEEPHNSFWMPVLGLPDIVNVTTEEKMKEIASKAKLGETAIEIVKNVEKTVSEIPSKLTMTAYWAANGRSAELRIRARMNDYERTILPKFFQKSEEKELTAYICQPSFVGDMNNALGKVHTISIEEVIEQRHDVVECIQEKLKVALSKKTPIPERLEKRLEAESKESEKKRLATAVRNLRRSMGKVSWLSEEEVVSMWREVQTEAVMKS